MLGGNKKKERVNKLVLCCYGKDGAKQVRTSHRKELSGKLFYRKETGLNVKKAESRRIDAFELWCWRRLLRVPWTAGRSNQSILKEISPGCSLERLMLKLKLQYFGYLMWRVDLLEKTLMLGGIGGRRRRGRQRMRWLDGITDLMDIVWVNSGSWWWTGRPGMLRFMGSQRVGHNWATELTEKFFNQLVMSSCRIKSSESLSVNGFKLFRHNKHVIPTSLSTFQI